MKDNRWVVISLLLIVVGAVMLLVNNAVYVPRFIALRDATLAWAKNGTGTSPPSFGSYGLDEMSFVVSAVLSFGYLLVFIGVAYLVILFIAKLAKRYGYVK